MSNPINPQTRISSQRPRLDQIPVGVDDAAAWSWHVAGEDKAFAYMDRLESGNLVVMYAGDAIEFANESLARTFVQGIAMGRKFKI